jgi:hypothetical protein
MMNRGTKMRFTAEPQVQLYANRIYSEIEAPALANKESVDRRQ